MSDVWYELKIFNGRGRLHKTTQSSRAYKDKNNKSQLQIDNATPEWIRSINRVRWT